MLVYFLGPRLFDSFLECRKLGVDSFEQTVYLRHCGVSFQ